MKARIASELSRPDLATQIADAITDSINIYQKERFRFSEVMPATPVTFQTVANQYVYTATDQANIGTIYSIDYLNVQLGSSIIKLERDTPENLKRLLQVGTQIGLPLRFAYEGNSIILYAVPDQAYTTFLGGHLQVAGPVNDSITGNPWMNDGERLIRARAKYEIALHVTRNVAMQTAMSPEPPPPGDTAGHASWRYWREIKGEANKITGQGRFLPMRF